jgi:hypothetical protein
MVSYHSQEYPKMSHMLYGSAMGFIHITFREDSLVVDYKGTDTDMTEDVLFHSPVADHKAMDIDISEKVLFIILSNLAASNRMLWSH